MRISVSMYSLNKIVRKEKWSVIDFIEYANRISLDGVELLDIYWDDKEKNIKEVKAALQRFNFPVSAYDVTNNFAKPSYNDWAKEVAKIEDGIRVAHQLGTNIVRVFCGDLHDELTYEEGQERIVKGLQQAAVAAKSAQIYLAIENHGLLAGKSEQIKEIIAKVNSPYVKSTFDTGNFLLVHEDPLEAFEKLKKEIVHVHFKDFRLKTENETLKGFHSIKGIEFIGTVPGDGQVDLAYLVNGLKDIDYNGWLSIEYEGHDDPKSSNEEAVRRLRNLIK
ncbi:sugar phosphate isomerase/epimerase [Cerasibacillus terrae]|uniref:Sugar phosphate isomerase/epimerase n=1 Tax=Cerasibacillus terrae TaxID=2498845 RepID=A0A5C8NJU1_9BACI|nr:sugar phosphate isomerase/epimerase family protein [Cerasibacillus terrae]TXL61081.1 sugar phosphate isomerase/epimerase [Cerasibacillus terrae]